MNNNLKEHLTTLHEQNVELIKALGLVAEKASDFQKHELVGEIFRLKLKLIRIDTRLISALCDNKPTPDRTE